MLFPSDDAAAAAGRQRLAPIGLCRREFSTPSRRGALPSSRAAELRTGSFPARGGHLVEEALSEVGILRVAH